MRHPWLLEDLPPALADTNARLLHLASHGMLPGSCAQVLPQHGAQSLASVCTFTYESKSWMNRSPIVGTVQTSGELVAIVEACVRARVARVVYNRGSANPVQVGIKLSVCAGGAAFTA